MKKIKDKLKQYYEDINGILDDDGKSRLLNKRHIQYKKSKDQELVTGAVVVILIIVILLSFAYYFLVFAPEQDRISDLKQEKINQVHTMLLDDNSPDALSLISQIENLNTLVEVENFNVEERVYPLLKNKLLEDVGTNKDNYNRIELTTGNSTDIMSTDNAVKIINSSNTSDLAQMSIKPVDSVIMPISITRKQAASGLLHVGDTVDVYSTNTPATDTSEEDNINSTDENTSLKESSTKGSMKISGGSKVVSILRSKDSGNIEKNIDLSESPKSWNLSQSSLLDVQEVMESKAAGTYDEKQIKVLVDEYASRLSDYERTSQLGDLDVEYIVMIEVPTSSVDVMIENMDNLILTIPTYDAPSWVKL